MRRFHGHIRLDELHEILKLSSLVDVKVGDPFGDGRIEFYIRKKQLQMKSKFQEIFREEGKDQEADDPEKKVEFFGYNIESIKQLGKG